MKVPALFFLALMLCAQGINGYAGELETAITEPGEESLVAIYFSAQGVITFEFSIPIEALIGYRLLKTDLYGNQPDSVVLKGNSAIFHFRESFRHGADYGLELTVRLAGEGQFSHTLYRYITFYDIGYNDIIISEIMANPLPVVLLPEAEYIEIFNRAPFPVSLDRWTICLGNRCVSIKGGLIQPNSYAVLCHADKVPIFDNSLTIVGVDKFPEINNAGQTIKLMNNMGQPIQHLTYSDTWHTGSHKANGGWSLEMVDTDNPCAGAENWASSINYTGGTPGQKNSVSQSNPDRKAPALINAVAVNDTVLVMRFSEKVILPEPTPLNGFVVSHQAGLPVRVVGSETPSEILELQFIKPFQPQVDYSLSFNLSIADCAGNLLEDSGPYPFYLAASADSFSLVINEILYSPFEKGGEFIEIYNRSGWCINLQQYSLANRDAVSGMLKNVSAITTSPYGLNASEHLALTLNPSLIHRYYGYTEGQNILKTEKLPSLPDMGGILVLTDSADRIMDEARYTPLMHHELVSRQKGVSLERIDPEAPSLMRDNWTSAAASHYFATPGAPNSQLKREATDRKAFAPDKDILFPYDEADELTINYKLEEGGYIANLIVFNRHGKPVKHLARNALLGTEGHFSWDGTDHAQMPLPVGSYIICVELFHKNGKQLKFKFTCIVAKK